MDKELFDLAVARGLYTKDYNTFRETYSTPANRTFLFSKLKEKGVYQKTEDDFLEEYYGVKKKPTKDLSTPSTSATAPSDMPSAPNYTWGSSGAEKITTPTYADQLREAPGYASPEATKEIVATNKLMAEDTARRTAIEKVRAKRNGDYTKTGDEFMDDYTREQISGKSALEENLGLTDPNQASTREYKFRTDAIKADILDLENGIEALDDQILKGLGDDAFQEQEALVTQINGLAAKLQPFEQNPPKTEKEINEFNDWAFQYNELVKRAQEFEEHPLVKERNQMAAAYDANVARVKQMLSDDRYKNVNEILGFAKKRQEAADVPASPMEVLARASVGLMIPGALPLTMGAEERSMLSNAFGRALSGVGRLMDVAETLTTGDKEYTKFDAIQDWFIGLEEDIAMSQPTPTKFARPLRTKTAKWKEFQVDVKDGKIEAIRDKQGRVVDKKISIADEEEILALPAKSQFNGYALPYKIGTTLADAGVMIFGAGKVAAPLKGVLGANMASKIGVTASTVGQMINPLYEEGMKMFNNKEKASQYALTTSTLIGISSNLFGLEARMIGGEGFLDDILKSTPKGVVTPVQRALGITKEGLGEMVEESVIEPLIDSAVRIQMGQPGKKWDKDEFVETAILSFATGAIMSGATGNVKKAALHTATQNVDGFEKELRSQAEQGLIEIDEIGIQRERAKVEKVKGLMNALEAPPEIIDLVEEKVELEEKKGRLEAANLPTEVVENQITAKNQEIMESLDKPIGSPAKDLITAFTEEVDGEKVTDFEAVREALQDPDTYGLSEEDVLEVRGMIGEAPALSQEPVDVTPGPVVEDAVAEPTQDQIEVQRIQAIKNQTERDVELGRFISRVLSEPGSSERIPIIGEAIRGEAVAEPPAAEETITPAINSETADSVDAIAPEPEITPLEESPIDALKNREIEILRELGKLEPNSPGKKITGNAKKEQAKLKAELAEVDDAISRIEEPSEPVEAETINPSEETLDEKTNMTFEEKHGITLEEAMREYSPSPEVATDLINELNEQGVKLKAKDKLDAPGAVVSFTPKPVVKGKVSGAESLLDIVSKDELRPAMTGIYVDGDNLVATDAMVLVSIKKKESDSAVIGFMNKLFEKSRKRLGGDFEKLKKKYIDDQVEGGLDKKIIGKDGVIDARYPDYKAIIPANPFVAEVSLPEIIAQVNGAKEALKNVKKPTVQFSFSGRQAFYDPDVLLRGLRVLEANGSKNAALEVSDTPASKGLLIRGDNGDFALVMPKVNVYQIPTTTPIEIEVGVDQGVLDNLIKDQKAKKSLLESMYEKDAQKGDARAIEKVAEGKAKRMEKIKELETLRVNNTEIKAAKKRLKDSLDTPLGVAYDPDKHAEQTIETFNALVDLAKLYIKQGVNNVVDFAKKVGKSVLEVIDAWVAAQVKNSPDLTQVKVQKLIPIGPKTQRFVEKFFKETFTAYGQLPKEVFNRNAKRIAGIDKRVSEASYIARRLQKFVTPENRADVMAALQGQAELLPAVENYDQLIEGVKEFRNLIDTASKEMIALGIVDGKLATTLDENMNLYVNRAYRIHTDKKWIDDVQKLPAFNKAVNWFIGTQTEFLSTLAGKRRIYDGYLANAQAKFNEFSGMTENQKKSEYWGKKIEQLEQSTQDEMDKVRQWSHNIPEDSTQEEIDRIETKAYAQEKAIMAKRNETLKKYTQYLLNSQDPAYFQNEAAKAEKATAFWENKIKALEEFTRLEEMKLAEPQAHVVGLLREQQVDVKQSSRMGSMNLGILGKRKELAPELRELFGEYDDPIITAMTTVFKQANLIENFKFLADVEAMGKGKFLFEVKTGDHTVQIAKSGTYAPLNEYFTTPEIAEAFSGKKEGIDPVIRWVAKFVSIPKYMNTIGSVMSHANNFFSGMWFHLQNGHFNAAKEFPNAFKTVWADAYGDSKKYQEKMLEYIEAGIIDDGIAMGEMKDALDVYKSLYSEPEGMEMVTQQKGLGKVKKAAEWAYKSEDRVHKIVGYELEKARYEKAGLTPSEAKEMASKRVRNGYPTYSLISKNVQRLRAIPFIATFPSFPYEVLRTTKNQMVAAYEDFQDPRTRGIGLQRAIGVSTAIALPYALSMMTMAALGLDDEDEDRIRLVAPEWDKNATYLFLNSTPEGATYIPFQRFIPIQQAAAPINALLNEKSETRFNDAVYQLIAPFMGTDMTTRVTMEAMFNEKLDSAKKVAAKDDPENVETRIKHAMKVFYPGTFNSIVKITESYSDNNPRKREPANEWMSLFSGIRMQKLDYDQNFSFVARDLGIRKKDNKAIYYTGQRQGSDETERATLAWEKMSRSAINYVEAYRGLGLEEKKIKQSLQRGGFNKEEIKAFLAGEVPELKFKD